MRLCANVADEFARTMSGQTLTPGVNLFSDGSSGLQSAKRKAQVLDDDDEGKKKRAPRKPRDPNAPKRPPSSYLLFQNEVRAELKAKFPELPNSELLQMISRRWATMSDEDKEVCNLFHCTARVLTSPAGCRCTANKMPQRRRHTQRRKRSTIQPMLQAVPLPPPLPSLPLRYVSCFT